MDITTSTNCLPIAQTQDLGSDLPTPVNMEAPLSPLEPEAERGQGPAAEDPGLLKSPAANEQVTVTLNSDGGNEVWIKPKSFGEGKCEGRELEAFYNDSPLGHGQVGGSGYRLNDPCGAGEGDVDYLLQTTGPSSDPEEAEDYPEVEDYPKTMEESYPRVMTEPDADSPGPATTIAEMEHREPVTEGGEQEVAFGERQMEPREMECRDQEEEPGEQEVEPEEAELGEQEVEPEEAEPGEQEVEREEQEMNCGEQEEEDSPQPPSDTACPGSPSTPEGVKIGDWKRPEEPDPLGEMQENEYKEPCMGEEEGKESEDCDPQLKKSFIEDLSTVPAEAEDTKTFTCGTSTVFDEVDVKPDKDTLLKESMEAGKESSDSQRCTSSAKPNAKDSSTGTEERKEEEYVSRRPRRATRLSFQAAEAQAQAQAAQTLSHRPQRHSRSLVKVTCANCRKPLQKGQTAYQRKGAPQLFCSSTCLTTYSQRPTSIKICTFCNKDIFNTKELVVAQAGSSQSFQEFCNTTCLSLYEAKLLKPTLSDESARCSICNKKGKILHEVSNGNVVHRLCSNACFSKFRASNGLKTNCCDNCGVYFYNRGFMLQYLYHEGQQRRFCNTGCLNMYKKKNTKVLPCAWCKTMGKNFDMIANVDTTGKMGFFCSLCCITSYKVKQSGTVAPKSKCRYCKKSVLERVYYNMTDRVVHQFCSPNCWTNFQQSTPEGCIQLNCTYCHNIFTGKPEILDWQGSVRQFCCKVCCEDYKRLHGVVSICEYCRQEKILHEKIKFSGVEKNFCSEGCVLLYKQDFTKNLGLCCITCAYCSQTCQRAVTKELDGNTWDFCGEECKSKYLLWYFKVARCHACKRQGKLLETVHWRGEIKHFCNQQCLLRFYSQQNQPNLATQKGPESLLNNQAQESKNAASPTPMKFETKASKPLPPSPPSPPPPPPVTLKNKAVLCKPLTQNKGISCKPEMKSKGCQTEEEWKPRLIVVPIPVPVFIPVPLHMYCQNTPVPLSVPIPVPIPMFLPTTLENTDKIVETIEELKVKIPSNPFEADILAMAEMIAEAEEMEKASSDLCDLASNQSADGLLEDCDLFGSGRDDVLAMAVKMANVLDEPGQDLEADFPKNPLELNSGVDFLFDCGLVTTDEDQAEPEIPRAVRRGQKRIVLSESCSRDSLTSQQCCTGLNYSYGVNAWKSWVQAKYASGETNKSEELRFGPKPMRIKEDILSCTAAELNYGLAQFVKEVQRPNGEHYEPDSVYYLCLGIQQYLLENNRMINIFTDLYYLTFVQELNKMLSGWQPSLLPNGLIFSRVEEEHLWECKQLGVYSPFVLLNTLMFFNTKYFGLRSVEEHIRLSFTSVVRQSRKCSTSRGSIKLVSIRYYLPAHCKKGRDQNSTVGKRKREEDVAVMEQRENRMNPLRCPVKFYEFYLSKCPESMKSRNDVFYLQPERSCVAESPLWYSVIPMDRSMLESMLNRILAVKEIYDDHSREALEEDDVEG
ncbi:zinc finger MYM-type protein 3 isoform X2 [Callorhinchus milii]|uniref:Zinc finger MYM-type containing 3 n=1 Tax=Callorhinchus milii TaxID=7868 RepID=A0A4W3K8E3_CALMI|nr:zinc finger MYM-type protein 3 isoform X2 [Callorhinchus milii]|eukprot:gi/632936053/ref/XP_007892255.1/ PREDICTED: zinc finger MYM-type protein 3 isoform X2 [Callorhinchus milii]